MVAFIWLFIAVGAMVTAIGSVWFLVVAFRTSVGWGLACMFIPFAALFFLIKYWHEVKIPFFVSIAGCVVAMVSVGAYAAYTASTGVSDFAEVGYGDSDLFQPADRDFAADDAPAGDQDWWDDQAAVEPPAPHSDPVPPTAGDATAAGNSAGGEAATEEQEPSPIGAIDLGDAPPPMPTPGSYGRRIWGDQVPLSQLATLIGRKIEIHTTEGTSFRAELDAVNEDSIRIKQRMGAGYVAYDLPLERVAAVRAKNN